MQPIISTQQMRQIDRLTVEEYDTPSVLLMEAAAAACFRAIASYFRDKLVRKRAWVLCGKGNNGGDGAALARMLWRSGVETDVTLLGKLSESKGDARTNLEILEGLSRSSAAARLAFTECEDIDSWEQILLTHQNYDLVVDALFGTGLSRPLEGIDERVVQHLSRIAKLRSSSRLKPLLVSIDIPSGLNADSSEILGETVRADLTITFTAPKPANVLPPASQFSGRLVVANIGSPPTLIESLNSELFLVEEEDAGKWLRQSRYTFGSYKNSHGHVLVVGGSRGYTGAAVLCGNSAIRSGAGLVTIATPASSQVPVACSAMPEIITTALAETDRGAVSDEALDHILGLASKATVLAIGPGLTSEDERTHHLVQLVVERRTIPIVIDADGLNCLAPWPDSLRGTKESPLVLTPHPGEMLRLMGTSDKAILSDRVSAVRSFATRHNVILLLKGSRSLIGAPDGRVFVNPTGNPGLGTAGSGDTLTGLIAGFLAQSFASSDNRDALAATIAALYIGGLAGDMAARKVGVRAMVASDIRQHIGKAIRYLDREGEQP